MKYSPLKRHAARKGTSYLACVTRKHPLISSKKPFLKKQEQEKTYRECLNIIVKAAQEEYKQAMYDRPNRQSFILKTYIWLSTVIFAGEVSLFSAIVSPSKYAYFYIPKIQEEYLFYVCVVLSLVSSFIAFVLGIFAFLGRVKIKPPYRDHYIDVAKKAHNDVFCGAHYTFQTVWLENLSSAINAQLDSCQEVGKRLRAISWLITFSIGTGVWATFC